MCAWRTPPGTPSEESCSLRPGRAFLERSSGFHVGTWLASLPFDPPSQSRVQELTQEVEQAFLQAPISGLVALVQDPLKHFEFEDLLCAHKYVMEHRLFSWIKVQNQEKGVAPFKRTDLQSGLGVLRPRDDVPLALRKMKAAQSPKQKRFHTHFKTSLNIIGRTHF